MHRPGDYRRNSLNSTVTRIDGALDELELEFKLEHDHGRHSLYSVASRFDNNNRPSTVSTMSCADRKERNDSRPSTVSVMSQAVIDEDNARSHGSDSRYSTVMGKAGTMSANTMSGYNAWVHTSPKDRIDKFNSQEGNLGNFGTGLGGEEMQEWDWEAEDRPRRPSFIHAHALSEEFLSKLPACVPRWLFDTMSNEFNLLVGAIVIANAVLVGLETDQGPKQFVLLEYFFGNFFIMEMLLRQQQLTCSGYWSEYQYWFDAFLVFAGCCDLYVNPLLQAEGETGVNVKLLRILRLLRMLRVLRVLRIFHLVHLMTVIMQAFWAAFTSVLSISTLLIVLNYIVAVMLTQAVGQHAEAFGDDREQVEAWFGTIGASMRTLFVIMTLVDWDVIAAVIIKVYHPMVVFPCFVLYILCSSYTAVSLITAVISESLVAAQQDDEKINAEHLQKCRAKLLNRIKNILHEIDADGSGALDRDEVMTVFNERPDFMDSLRALDIHITMEDLLNLLERLQPPGALSADSAEVGIDEVVEALVNISGTAKASALFDLKHIVFGAKKDIASVRSEIADCRELVQKIGTRMAK